MPGDMGESVREEFEAWYEKTRGIKPHWFSRDQCYEGFAAEHWPAWQAATAATARKCAEIASEGFNHAYTGDEIADAIHDAFPEVFK